MKQLVIYVHGKDGTIDEADHYRVLFKDSDIIGLDYESKNPWEAKIEFPQLFDLYSKGYDSIILIANSIGAYFSMISLGNKNISQAFFISPIVNMERLIIDMMLWANVTEEELHNKKEIDTNFGEKLSWDYLCFARKNPINWHIPTHILYGGKDNLTSRETIFSFSRQIKATLTIMEDGEHYFHLEKQMEFIDEWIKKLV